MFWNFTKQREKKQQTQNFETKLLKNSNIKTLSIRLNQKNQNKYAHKKNHDNFGSIYAELQKI